MKAVCAYLSFPCSLLNPTKLLSKTTNAMARCQRSLFESSQWRKVLSTGRSRGLRDQLLDIVVDIPGYLEDLDQVRACKNCAKSLKSYQDLLSRCLKTERARLGWDMEAGSTMQRFDCGVTGLPVPKISRDNDLHMLNLSCFYWAMWVQLHLIIDCLLEGDCSYPREREPLAQTSQLSSLNPGSYAHKIAHCVHLHFEPEAGGLGANLGIMPLVVAWLYLKGLRDESDQQNADLRSLNNLLERPKLDMYSGRFFDSVSSVFN